MNLDLYVVGGNSEQWHNSWRKVNYKFEYLSCINGDKNKYSYKIFYRRKLNVTHPKWVKKIMNKKGD